MVLLAQSVVKVLAVTNYRPSPPDRTGARVRPPSLPAHPHANGCSVVQRG